MLGAGTYASPLSLSKDIVLAAQGSVILSGGIDLNGHQLTLCSDATGMLKSSGSIIDGVGTGLVTISGGFVNFAQTGVNTYIGDTTINAGATLSIDGSITSAVVDR